jgi:hypothetical protein
VKWPACCSHSRFSRDGLATRGRRVGFLLFRAFDIAKPPPALLAEALPGGLGVMADDLVAGIYANLCGQLLFRWIWPEVAA